jgi:hypothetical protein
MMDREGKGREEKGREREEQGGEERWESGCKICILGKREKHDDRAFIITTLHHNYVTS